METLDAQVRDDVVEVVAMVEVGPKTMVNAALKEGFERAFVADLVMRWKQFKSRMQLSAKQVIVLRDVRRKLEDSRAEWAAKQAARRFRKAANQTEMKHGNEANEVGVTTIAAGFACPEGQQG